MDWAFISEAQKSRQNFINWIVSCKKELVRQLKEIKLQMVDV